MSENPSADGYCSSSHYIPLLTAFHTSWFKKFAFSTNLSLPSYIYIYIYHMYTCPLATVMGLRWCTPHARDQTVKGQEAEGRGVPELFSARRCKFGTPKILRITGGGSWGGSFGGGSGSCIPMMYGWWFLYVFVTSMDDSGGTKWKWFSMVVIVWLMFL